jgi:hypothetical protein
MTMSLDLALVSQIMYLREGEINPGDDDKVIRYEKKMADWKCDVVDRKLNKVPTREDMSSASMETGVRRREVRLLENSLGGSRQ